MKSLLLYISFCLCFTFDTIVYGQQLVNIDVVATSVSHQFQCSSDAIIGGSTQPDPRYRVRARYLNSGVGSGYGPVNIINLGNGVPCNNNIPIPAPNPSLLSVTGVCADAVQIHVDMWEEDGCGGDNTFNPTNGNSCIDNDDNRTQVWPVYTFGSGINTGTNSVTVSGTVGYAVDIDITYSIIPAPTDISTTMTLCDAGIAVLAVSTPQTISGMDFYWYNAPIGGGVVNIGATFTPNVNASTTYYVAYGSPSTCETARTPISVTVDSPPTPANAGADISACDPLIWLSGNAPTVGSGAWSTISGPGIVDVPSTSNSSVSNMTAGMVTNFEWVTVNGVCPASRDTIEVVYYDLPPAPDSAISSTNPICPGDLTTLRAFSLNPLPTDYAYVWYTGACGAIPVGLGASIDVSPSATTTYYVSAVGTCGSTVCSSVNVNVEPGSTPADAILTDNNNFCEGESANLTIDGGSLAPGAQWVWYEGNCNGGSINSGTSISISPLSNTSYYVRAEGGSCGNTVCADLVINVHDVHTYLTPQDPICTDGNSQHLLEGGLPSGGSYTGLGVSGGYINTIISGIGTHTITYSYTDATGCTGSAIEQIVVNESPITASAQVITKSCSEGGNTIVISTNGGNGFYSYNWSNGEMSNPLYFVEPGTYGIEIIDQNNCSTTLLDIEVTENLDCIEVVNTFTPNNDGTNDTWNLDFSNYSSASLQVFSKWGNVVYETSGTIIHWDGRSLGGENLPAATYYYIIDLDGGSKSQNGPITIVR